MSQFQAMRAVRAICFLSKHSVPRIKFPCRRSGRRIVPSAINPAISTLKLGWDNLPTKRARPSYSHPCASQQVSAHISHTEAIPFWENLSSRFFSPINPFSYGSLSREDGNMCPPGKVGVQNRLWLPRSRRIRIRRTWPRQVLTRGARRPRPSSTPHTPYAIVRKPSESLR